MLSEQFYWIGPSDSSTATEYHPEAGGRRSLSRVPSLVWPPPRTRRGHAVRQLGVVDVRHGLVGDGEGKGQKLKLMNVICRIFNDYVKILSTFSALLFSYEY